MKIAASLFFSLWIVGCATNTITEFSVKAHPKEGVDEIAARKIALTWLLSKRNQKGGAEIDVYRRSEKAKESCYSDKYYSELLGEYCGADYFLATKYRVGHDAYHVLETCQNHLCIYTISEVDVGIEE